MANVRPSSGAATLSETTQARRTAANRPTAMGDGVEPARAHGNRRARGGAAAEPGSASIGTAHRVLNRAPTVVSAMNATTKKAISGHVTPGPEVTGSMNRK